MGVNIFVVTPNIERVEDVDIIADAINGIFGGDSENPQFDWCGLFTGEEGYLLSIEAALKFPQEAAPFGMIVEDEKGIKESVFTESLTDPLEPHVWKAMLRQYQDDGNHQVVFLKARL